MLRLRRAIRSKFHCDVHHVSSIYRHQIAEMSKGGQGSEGMDSQIQTIVRALQPQEVVETPLSPEELAEAEKRYGTTTTAQCH